MIPLPDSIEIPAIGTLERDAQEREALARARELIHEENGRLGDALYYLKSELEGKLWERDNPRQVRVYAQALCDHVEQCWATRIVG